jgi:glucosamine kinase
MKGNYLIADSGSTKTDWILLQNGEKIRFTTKGLNPQIQKESEILDILSELKNYCKTEHIDHVYFYGAGCSREENCMRISEALKKVICLDQVFVEHDLLAAARALFRHQEGIACILGTGSNSGVYNGSQITENIPALGYILGDEGSGAHIGKAFLRDYLYNNVPPEVSDLFSLEFSLSVAEIFNKTYRESNANVFLASVGGFVSRNTKHSYCNKLLSKSFLAFIQHHILPYKEIRTLPIGFVGSIAERNQHIMMELLHKMSLKAGIFISSPIENLLAYHVTLPTK